MFNRLLSSATYASSTFFRQQRKHSLTWHGPQDPQTFHPCDILSVLCEEQHLQKSPNGYINLHDHISGAGFGATFSGAQQLQKEYKPYSQVALALKYPQILSYAKLYKDTQKELRNNISESVQIAAHHMRIDDEYPSKNSLIPKQIEISSQHLMHDAINTQMPHDLETIFGTRTTIDAFDSKEIERVHKVTQHLINTNQSILEAEPQLFERHSNLPKKRI